MREVDRLGVIREVVGKHLRQREAGERVGLSVRQVKRLLRRYREEGARGLRSRRRGRRVRWSRLVGQGGGRDKVYSGRPIIPPESCFS